MDPLSQTDHSVCIEVYSSYSDPMSLQQIIQKLPLTYPVLCDIAGSTTLLVWDTCLTFDEEIEFIWSRFRFNSVKVLYCTVRYLAFIIYCGIPFAFFGNYRKFSLCSEIMWLITFSGAVIIACSNMLLIQRVYAFYERSKPLLWLLSIIFVLIESSVVVIMTLGVPKYQVVQLEVFPPPFGHCLVTKVPGILSFVLFLELGFQSIAFACIVARFVLLQLSAWRTGIPNSPLYVVFLRDGIWVFVFMFVIFLLTGIFMHTQSATGLSFALWTYTASSICSTRLILNLNRSANRDYITSNPCEVT